MMHRVQSRACCVYRRLAPVRQADRLRQAVAALATILIATGCGGERIYPVSLSVLLADGGPARSCSIMLRREEAPPTIAGGRIGPDGSCAPIVAGRTSPGLPAGTYRAVVSADTGPPSDGPRKPLPFNDRYSNPEQSDLEFVVGQGQDPRVILKLAP